MTSPESRYAGVVGAFEHVDALVEAVKQARTAGLEIRDVYSPVPVEAIGDLVLPQKSPVRFFTLVGGLAGLVGGMALCILTALIWNIVVGGKPVTSHVPFVVVAFEGLILLGALFTFLGLLLAGRLPFIGFPCRAYRPEFSRDRFGLWLGCPMHEIPKARAFLEKAGASEIRPVGEGARQGGRS